MGAEHHFRIVVEGFWANSSRFDWKASQRTKQKKGWCVFRPRMTKLVKAWFSKTCKLDTVFAPRMAKTHKTTLVHFGAQNQDCAHRRVPDWWRPHRKYPATLSFSSQKSDSPWILWDHKNRPKPVSSCDIWARNINFELWLMLFGPIWVDLVERLPNARSKKWVGVFSGQGWRN